MASSEQAHRRCHGKQAHTSKARATAIMRQMQRNPRTRNPHRLNVYKCATCQRWHIGHRMASSSQP